MALNLNLDSIKALPGYQKALMVAILVIAVLGAFVWFVYIPKNAEIAALEQKVAEINNQINVNQAKARRFEELKVDHEGREISELTPLETAVRPLAKLVAVPTSDTASILTLEGAAPNSAA